MLSSIYLFIYLSFGTYSSVSFCLDFTVCFYEAATFPVHQRVALCRNMPCVELCVPMAFGPARGGWLGAEVSQGTWLWGGPGGVVSWSWIRYVMW